MEGTGSPLFSSISVSLKLLFGFASSRERVQLAKLGPVNSHTEAKPHIQPVKADGFLIVISSWIKT